MASLISRSFSTTAVLLLVALSATIPTTECTCSDAMATVLSSSGFLLFAHALHAHKLTPNSTAIVTRLTYLVPPDTALTNQPLDENTIRGHVLAAGAFPYQSLLALPTNTTLPTLHNSTTLTVSTEGKEVSLNDVLVVVPNHYVDSSCVIHGVAGPLAPIPPTLDDDNSPQPKTQNQHSQVVPRRQARQLSKHARFIRRASHPSPLTKNPNTSFP